MEHRPFVHAAFRHPLLPLPSETCDAVAATAGAGGAEKPWQPARREGSQGGKKGREALTAPEPSHAFRRSADLGPTFGEEARWSGRGCLDWGPFNIPYQTKLFHRWINPSFLFPVGLSVFSCTRERPTTHNPGRKILVGSLLWEFNLTVDIRYQWIIFH